MHAHGKSDCNTNNKLSCFCTRQLCCSVWLVNWASVYSFCGGQSTKDQCLHNYKEWESTNSTLWKFCKYSTELICNIPRLVSSSNKPQGGRTSRVWHWSLGARVQTLSLLMQILNKLWRWATLPCSSIRASAVVQVAVALWRSQFTMTLWHWVLSEPRIGWLVTRTTPTLSKDHRYVLTTTQRESHSAVRAMGH